MNSLILKINCYTIFCITLAGCGADNSSVMPHVVGAGGSDTNVGCKDTSVYGEWSLVSDRNQKLSLKSDCTEGNNTYTTGVEGFNKTLIFKDPEPILFNSKNCIYSGHSTSNNSFLSLTCDNGTFNYSINPVNLGP